MVGDVGGLKVEREAVIGDNKEEEEDVRKVDNNLIEQDRTFPGGEKAASDKSGRQKATEVEGRLPGNQALARGGGGQHALQGGEQHALVAGGGGGRQRVAGLVLAAALCYHLLL